MNNLEKNRKKELDRVLLELIEIEGSFIFKDLIEVYNLILKIGNPYIFDEYGNETNIPVLDTIAIKSEYSNKIFTGNTFKNNIPLYIGIYELTDIGFKFLTNKKVDNSNIRWYSEGSKYMKDNYMNYL
jgi:hypothetical protein